MLTMAARTRHAPAPSPSPATGPCGRPRPLRHRRRCIPHWVSLTALTVSHAWRSAGLSVTGTPAFTRRRGRARTGTAVCDLRRYRPSHPRGQRLTVMAGASAESICAHGWSYPVRTSVGLVGTLSRTVAAQGRGRRARTLGVDTIARNLRCTGAGATSRPPRPGSAVRRRRRGQHHRRRRRPRQREPLSASCRAARRAHRRTRSTR